MAWYHSETMKTYRRHTVANWLFFLLALIAIGATLYVSILVIPAITAGLGSAAALAAVPQGIINLIAVLPLIFTLGILLRFAQFNHETSEKEISHEWVERDLKPQHYITGMFIRSFLLTARPPLGQNLIAPEPPRWLSAYNTLAFMTAIGLGIFLSVKIMPALVAEVVSAGTPFGLAVFFAALATVGLMALLYRTLALGISIRNVWLKRHSPKDNLEDETYKTRTVLYALGAGFGMMAGVMLSRVFFGALVNALSPFLMHSTAVFTAIVISIGLTLFLMRAVSGLGWFIFKELPEAREKLKEPHSELINPHKTSSVAHSTHLSGERASSAITTIRTPLVTVEPPSSHQQTQQPAK